MECAVLKILLVEDNHDVAEIMAIMLERLGHQVIHADCITRAVQSYESAPIDVVIADYRLPDGNAPLLLGRLKAHRPARAILLSATNPDDLPPATRQGFASCLQKPADIPALTQAIAQAKAFNPST